MDHAVVAAGLPPLLLHLLLHIFVFFFHFLFLFFFHFLFSCELPLGPLQAHQLEQGLDRAAPSSLPTFRHLQVEERQQGDRERVESRAGCVAEARGACPGLGEAGQGRGVGLLLQGVRRRRRRKRGRKGKRRRRRRARSVPRRADRLSHGRALPARVPPAHRQVALDPCARVDYFRDRHPGAEDQPRPGGDDPDAGELPRQRSQELRLIVAREVLERARG